MRDELKRTYLRFARLAVAFAIGGAALQIAMHPLLEALRPYSVRYRKTSLSLDEFWNALPHPASTAARLSRAVVIVVSEQKLSADESLTVSDDPAFCNALAAAQRARLAADNPFADSSDAIGRAGGVLIVGDLWYRLEPVSLVGGGAKPCTLVLRVPRDIELFDADATPESDAHRIVRFTSAIGAQQSIFELHTSRVRVVGMDATPVLQTDARTRFELTGSGMEEEHRFGIVRAAGPVRRFRPVIRSVLAHFESRYIPGLSTLFSAVLLILPYALIAALAARRRLRAFRHPAEIAAALLLLLMVVGAGLVASEAVAFVRPQGKLGNYSPSLMFGAPAWAAAFVAAGWPLLARAWALRRAEPAGARPMSRVAIVAAATALVAAAACAALVACAPASESDATPPPLQIPIVAAAVAAALAVCIWIAAEVTERFRVRITAALAVAAVGLGLIDAVFDREGVWPAAAVVAIAFLIATLAFLNARWWRRGRGLALALVAVAAIAVLLTHDATSVSRDSLYFVDSADKLLWLVVAGALIVPLERLSAATRRAPAAARAARIVLALTFFFSEARGVFGIVEVLAAYALLRWWSFVPRTAASHELPAHGVREAVRNRIAANEAEAMLDAARKEMRNKIADASVTYSEYEKHIGAIEDAVERKRAYVAAQRTQSGVFVAGPALPPWERGVRAAAYATLLAVPWFLLFVAAQRVPGVAVQWLSVVGVFITAAVQWPLSGFFFGYFYPSLRGANGLQKGLVWFATLIVPSLVAAFLFRAEGDGPNRVYMLWFPQQFIQCLTLGLLGDYETLKEAGLRWRHLRDVHNLGVLTACASSVVVAIGVALSTAAANGMMAAAGKLVKSLLGLS
ncbi:MAG TPA: hypothetical protein VF824_08095 [Thermoanaerobaculia bacterium]